jgi:Zn-dependent protease with chaperone function
MRKEVWSNYPYIFWLLFYFVLFGVIFGANVNSFMNVAVVYALSIAFALTPLAEGLYRGVSGVRRIATAQERNRLLPLFEEVYAEALRTDPKLPKGINLYIQNDMDINAFAFGRGTMVLTRGSIELLDDECLKGLMAHEFGHFSHYDTVVILFAYIGNLSLSLLMKCVYGIANVLLYMVRNKDSIYTFVFRLAHSIIIGVYKLILFIGDLILMSVSREHEYMADAFANRSGYGRELIDVLYQIHQVSISQPNSVIEQLRSTHPPLTERIRLLEELKNQAPVIREIPPPRAKRLEGYYKPPTPLSVLITKFTNPRLHKNDEFSLADVPDEHYRVIDRIIYKYQTYLYVSRIDNKSCPTGYSVIVSKTVDDYGVSLQKVRNKELYSYLMTQFEKRKGER